MKHKTNFQDAATLASNFRQMLDNASIDLEKDIMPCMHEIEKIIQPNREFVEERWSEFTEDDEQAMYYREALEYNDGAIFLGNLYTKNGVNLTPEDLLEALSIGWTPDTYKEIADLREQIYKSDKFLFEPTDYYTLLMDSCNDEQLTFDEYVQEQGGMDHFILTSILSYFGSNLAQALEKIINGDPESSKTSEEDPGAKDVETALKKFGVSSVAELRGDDVDKYVEYLMELTDKRLNSN